MVDFEFEKQLLEDFKDLDFWLDFAAFASLGTGSVGKFIDDIVGLAGKGLKGAALKKEISKIISTVPEQALKVPAEQATESLTTMTSGMNIRALKQGLAQGDTVGEAFLRVNKLDPNVKIENVQGFFKEQGIDAAKVVGKETTESVTKDITNFIRPTEKAIKENNLYRLTNWWEYTPAEAKVINDEIGTFQKAFKWIKQASKDTLGLAKRFPKVTGVVTVTALGAAALHTIIGTALTAQGTAGAFTWAAVDNVANQGSFYYTSLVKSAKEDPTNAQKYLDLMDDYEETVQIAADFIKTTTASVPALIPAEQMIKAAFESSVIVMTTRRAELEALVIKSIEREEAILGGEGRPEGQSDEDRLADFPGEITTGHHEGFSNLGGDGGIGKSRELGLFDGPTDAERKQAARDAKAHSARRAAPRTIAPKGQIKQDKKARVRGIIQ